MSMGGILKDYLKVVCSHARTRYGYAGLGVLALEILLKDMLGIPKLEGAASSGLTWGNAVLGISSCASLASARFGIPMLRAYYHGQRALQFLDRNDFCSRPLSLRFQNLVM